MTERVRGERARKAGPEEVEPDLLARVLEAGCSRLALIGLHAGAGARTVAEALAARASERGMHLALASVPRNGRDDDEAERASRMRLPEGTIVATAAAALDETDALEVCAPGDEDSPLGQLRVARVARGGEVPVHGTDEPRTLAALIAELEARGSGGPVLLEGDWERHGFAAPEFAGAAVLAVGAGYSASLERSAAAVRYAAEVLGLGRSDIPADRVLREAAGERAALAVDANGRRIARVASGEADPSPALSALGSELAAVVFPEFLSDSMLAALVRSAVRCTLVVRDPTKLRVSPVYLTAWRKGGGRVAVVEPMRLLAVTTNPTNPNGPDADGPEFRRLVAKAVPGLPVHDVRLEASGKERRPAWKFWG